MRFYGFYTLKSALWAVKLFGWLFPYDRKARHLSLRAESVRIKERQRGREGARLR